ncbi:MAG: FAD-dependent oxidoreductase [Pseudomonadota bacterium]
MAQSSDKQVAVVGGGMAGLACARRLVAAGADVSVFDKGRGPGGRMSSRRTEIGRFDHGAQYMTARSDGFRDAMTGWIAAGVAAEWRGRFGVHGDGAVMEEPVREPRFVGAPRMNAIVAHEAEALGVRFGVEISELARSDRGWRLSSKEGDAVGEFDAVVAAVPAEQAAQLLKAVPALATEAEAARSAPCWAAMFGYDAPLDCGFDAVKSKSGPIAWLAREGAKPGRDAGERVVVHASPDWSAAHLELQPEEIAGRLAAALSELIGAPGPNFAQAHRWRFAQVAKPAESAFAYDPTQGIGVCGDWRIGPRVEAAWTSGDALGEAVTATL